MEKHISRKHAVGRVLLDAEGCGTGIHSWMLKSKVLEFRNPSLLSAERS